MTPIKQLPYTPILGWSASRFDTFKTCRRRYFYTYYAKFDREFPLSKINQLKALTTIPLETGNIVHDVIKVLLERFQKSHARIDLPKFHDYTRKLTGRYCEKPFAEIYYQEISRLNVDEIFENVRLCLDNLLNSPRFHWLIQNAIATRDRWIIEPPGYGQTVIKEYKAYCKVDFLFPVGDKLYIMDWKTGKADAVKHHKQMLGYAAWAAFHFGHDPESIDPVIAYLKPDYTEDALHVTRADIDGFAKIVKNETLEMYSFCADIEENIPKEKGLFEKTPLKVFGDYCNFRELCREKTAAGP